MAVAVLAAAGRRRIPVECPNPTGANPHGGYYAQDGTADELLTMVRIALGQADGETCAAGDTDRDNRITINDLLTAVNNARTGCAS